MAIIIAGGFENVVQAQEAMARLAAAGVDADSMCEFAVNAPGQHDRTPIGGDRPDSPGAHTAGAEAVKSGAVGAVAGAVAGITATPLLGPAGIAAGAGVGAYTGSLVGGMKRGVDREPQPDHTVLRPAEALVAVNRDGAIGEMEIVRIMEQCGAWQVERTEGTWANGEWVDFDPALSPHLIGGCDPNAGTGHGPAPRTR
jgi:hypothetical protein